MGPTAVPFPCSLSGQSFSWGVGKWIWRMVPSKFYINKVMWLLYYPTVHYLTCSQMRGQLKRRDWKMDWWNLPICCGEERDEHKNDPVELLFNLHSYLHLWSWALDRMNEDWKNEIVDTSSRNEFPEKGEKLGHSSSPLFHIEKSQLRGFGHLTRMPPHSLQGKCSGHILSGGGLGQTQDSLGRFQVIECHWLCHWLNV